MKRVVVTGLGLVTPLGVGVKKSWARLVAGESGIRSTTELGPEFQSLSSRVAAWIAGIDFEQALEAERDLKVLPRYVQFAVLAAGEAIKDAGVSRDISNGVAPNGSNA